jgi:hypothetical protein
MHALFDMYDSCCDSLWNVSCGRSPDEFRMQGARFQGWSMELTRAKELNKEIGLKAQTWVICY